MRAAILGAGSWGTALAIHLGRRGLGRAAVGARPRDRGGHRRAPARNPFYLEDVAASRPASPPPPILDEAVGRRGRGPAGRAVGVRGQDAQERPGAARRGCRRSLGHQGLRSRAPPPHERAHRRALPRGAGGRALRPDLRAGGGAAGSPRRPCSRPPTRPWPLDCAMPGARASSGSTPTATWRAWRSAAP